MNDGFVYKTRLRLACAMAASAEFLRSRPPQPRVRRPKIAVQALDWHSNLMAGALLCSSSSALDVFKLRQFESLLRQLMLFSAAALSVSTAATS